MQWPLEKIKDVAAAVQNVAITIAVIIGDFWALYVFTALEQREKAELDVKKAVNEKLKQEQELQPRAIVNLTISIMQPGWFGKSSHLVQVASNAKTWGTGSRYCVYLRPPFACTLSQLNQMEKSP